MATDMKYYKNLLVGMGGASLGAAMSKAIKGKGAGSIIAVSYTHLTLPTTPYV